MSEHLLYGVTVDIKDLKRPLALEEYAAKAIIGYAGKVKDERIRLEDTDTLGFLVGSDVIIHYDLARLKSGKEGLLGYELRNKRGVRKDTLYFGKLEDKKE